MAPLVSVVLPAYRAAGTICDAVRSVLAAGLPESGIEILIEADDATDYSAAAALSPAVRLAHAGTDGSGCGPSRNRAIARARGDYLAFLDADDLFSPGYLAALLPLAQKTGAAAAPLRVTEAGQPVLELWRGQDQLGYNDLAASGASVRLMVAARLCPPFVDALSQDIAHALRVMAGQGGRLPLSAPPYELRLTKGSLTSEADFARRVDGAYADYICSFSADPAMPEAATAVFRAKQALNRAYIAAGTVGYYRFIAERLHPAGGTIAGVASEE